MKAMKDGKSASPTWAYPDKQFGIYSFISLLWCHPGHASEAILQHHASLGCWVGLKTLLV